MLHLEITEVLLAHCNILNNDSQQDSKDLYKLIVNNSLGQLLYISPKSITFLKSFNSEFSHNEA